MTDWSRKVVFGPGWRVAAGCAFAGVVHHPVFGALRCGVRAQCGASASIIRGCATGFGAHPKEKSSRADDFRHWPRVAPAGRQTSRPSGTLLAPMQASSDGETPGRRQVISAAAAFSAGFVEAALTATSVPCCLSRPALSAGLSRSPWQADRAWRQDIPGRFPHRLARTRTV